MSTDVTRFADFVQVTKRALPELRSMCDGNRGVMAEILSEHQVCEEQL
jgi:hypothetical protein